eukprot:TRINITY_DN1756_c0_g1_i1.p1 TRINITY_DN1756_c0_g1~~TRINITY_DN1756_c0_g1_i1.p1  ORF type:complete len:241 (+),score=59.70 TRINITY_DN1756_c0_g1_i1:83-805(+)
MVKAEVFKAMAITASIFFFIGAMTYCTVNILLIFFYSATKYFYLNYLFLGATILFEIATIFSTAIVHSDKTLPPKYKTLVFVHNGFYFITFLSYMSYQICAVIPRIYNSDKLVYVGETTTLGATALFGAILLTTLRADWDVTIFCQNLKAGWERDRNTCKIKKMLVIIRAFSAAHVVTLLLLPYFTNLITGTHGGNLYARILYRVVFGTITLQFAVGSILSVIVISLRSAAQTAVNTETA